MRKKNQNKMRTEKRIAPIVKKERINNRDIQRQFYAEIDELIEETERELNYEFE